MSLLKSDCLGRKAVKASAPVDNGRPSVCRATSSQCVSLPRLSGTYPHIHSTTLIPRNLFPAPICTLLRSRSRPLAFCPPVLFCLRPAPLLPPHVMSPPPPHPLSTFGRISFGTSMSELACKARSCGGLYVCPCFHTVPVFFLLTLSSPTAPMALRLLKLP